MTASPHYSDTDPRLMTRLRLPLRCSPRADLQLQPPLPATFRSKTTRTLQLRIWTPMRHLHKGPRRRAAASVTMRHTSTANPVWKANDFVDHRMPTVMKPAFIAIRDVLMNAPEPMTLVAIGAIDQYCVATSMHYPACVKHSRLVLMGGSAGRGNFTPTLNLTLLSIRRRPRIS